MFENIEQLEQEIETFRKNILASTELINHLDTLITSIKAQSNGFKKASSDLISKMDDFTADVKQSSAETLRQMTAELNQCTIELGQLTDKAIKQIDSNNKQTLSEAVAQIHAEQQIYVEKLETTSITLENLRISNESVNQVFSEKCDSMVVSIENAIERLSTDNKAHLDGTVTQFAEVQAEYVKSLQQTEGTMRQLSVDLTQKYNEFLARLEETNMGQVYQTCLDIKKSVDIKLMIAIVATGVSAIAAIISIFVK